MSVALKTCTAFPGVWSPKSYAKTFQSPNPRKKANPAEFGNWIKDQPWSTKRIIVPSKKDERWGKIERIFYKNIFYDNNGKKVTKEDPQGSFKTVIAYKQKYIICLDPNSEFAGNIYNDDSIGYIYTKFVVMLLLRPIHLVVTTVYCVSLIRTAVVIGEGLITGSPAKKILQNVVCSLVDIVRNPLYGVVLAIINVAGILLIPFHPPLAYDIRAIIGRLNRELGWGKRLDFPFDFTQCMYPLINIMEYTLNDQSEYDKTTYEDVSNQVLIGLDNRLRDEDQ